MKTKINISASLVVIATLILSFSFVGYQNSGIPDKSFAGKLMVSFYVNNQPTQIMPSKDIYIYGNFCLEESRISLVHQNKKLDKDGNVTKSTTINKDSVHAYILTDLNKKKSYQFNNSVSNPKLDSVYNVINKKHGFNFKDDNIQLDELGTFVLIKDSLINGRNYSQIKSVKDVGATKQITTIYLDKNLKLFPFHPLSKYLDDKFDGLATICETDFGNQSFKIEYNFTPVLNESELKQIKKYIAITEEK